MAQNFLTDVNLNGNGMLEVGQRTISSGSIINPPALTTNTDNFNPAGFQACSTVRISSTSAINLTGIIAPDTDRSMNIVLVNIGSFPITLINSATSTAANQFLLGDNIVLSANRSYMLYYDQTSDRWRDYGTGLTSLEGSTIKTVNNQTMAGPGNIDTLLTLNADAPTQESANLVANELQLVQATPSTDGVMSSEDKTKLDGIATSANNYTHPNHSGEVTSVGDGVQTVDKTAITNKGTVTPVSGDFVLISDTSDSGNLKKVDADNFLVGLPTKADQVDGTLFTGSPKKSSAITFTTPFADAGYTVAVTGTLDTRAFTVESVAAGSFVINSNSGSALIGTVYWVATKHGES